MTICNFGFFEHFHGQTKLLAKLTAVYIEQQAIDKTERYRKKSNNVVELKE